MHTLDSVYIFKNDFEIYFIFLCKRQENKQTQTFHCKYFAWLCLQSIWSDMVLIRIWIVSTLHATDIHIVLFWAKFTLDKHFGCSGDSPISMQLWLRGQWEPALEHLYIHLNMGSPMRVLWSFLVPLSLPVFLYPRVFTLAFFSEHVWEFLVFHLFHEYVFLQIKNNIPGNVGTASELSVHISLPSTVYAGKLHCGHFCIAFQLCKMTLFPVKLP